MENEQRRIVIPKVDQDDFLHMMSLTHTEAWKELAFEQPELAREIEQQANTLRVLLETHKISPLEAARLSINTAVFAAEALTLAVRRKNAQPPSGDEPHTEPPKAA